MKFVQFGQDKIQRAVFNQTNCVINISTRTQFRVKNRTIVFSSSTNLKHLKLYYNSMLYTHMIYKNTTAMSNQNIETITSFHELHCQVLS